VVGFASAGGAAGELAASAGGAGVRGLASWWLVVGGFARVGGDQRQRGSGGQWCRLGLRGARVGRGRLVIVNVFGRELVEDCFDGVVGGAGEA
jgi:hypothetical protein